MPKRKQPAKSEEVQSNKGKKSNSVNTVSSKKVVGKTPAKTTPKNTDKVH
jgi:hypothetical protein